MTKLDPANLPTSVLINLYTVAIDGEDTEYHKAMRAREANVRATGSRRAGQESYPVQVSFLPGTGKRKAPAKVDTKLSTHTGTASSVANTARTNIHN